MRTLLCLLALAGLIGSAYARPLAMPMQPAHDMVQLDDASGSMAGEMPCCPEKMPDCAQDCPSLMLCLAKAFTAAAHGTPLRIVMLLAAASPFDDAILQSVAARPPSPPPNA